MNIGSETEQIEFKKSNGEINEGIVSIAAILNKHQSGELYFGVKNDGTVLGRRLGILRFAQSASLFGTISDQ